ncbi:MAG: flagellar filament capping protein FliD, partial [Lutispora sp.]|nr:flagellar filament capping protein FliD [Lutispora sp.]
NMRRVMGDMTEAGGLFSIGISTGNWREGAKLNIDEDKLKKAIADNPDQVMNIFAKQSSVAYHPDNTKEQKDLRYAESGIVERLFDIIQDNIRTTRNADGKKGMLLEKAGIVGDLTEFQSTLVDEINKKESLIEDMTVKLFNKESALYMKFASLETALSRMNSQSAWLAQSFGSNQR